MALKGMDKGSRTVKSTRRYRIAYAICLGVARLWIVLSALGLLAGVFQASSLRMHPWDWDRWWRHNGVYFILGSGLPIGLFLQHLIKITWPTQNPSDEVISIKPLLGVCIGVAGLGAVALLRPNNGEHRCSLCDDVYRSIRSLTEADYLTYLKADRGLEAMAYDKVPPFPSKLGAAMDSIVAKGPAVVDCLLAKLDDPTPVCSSEFSGNSSFMQYGLGLFYDCNRLDPSVSKMAYESPTMLMRSLAGFETVTMGQVCFQLLGNITYRSFGRMFRVTKSSICLTDLSPGSPVVAQARKEWGGLTRDAFLDKLRFDMTNPDDPLRALGSEARYVYYGGERIE